MDEDKNGMISFTELIQGLSLMSSSASREEKLKCVCVFFLKLLTGILVANKLYNVNRDFISREELKQMLQVDMEENSIKLKDVDIDSVVDDLFSESAGTDNAHKNETEID